MALGFFIGPLEFVILVAVVIFLFGGKRLVAAGRGLGRGAREFKDSIQGEDSESKPNELPPPRRPAERDEL